MSENKSEEPAKKTDSPIRALLRQAFKPLSFLLLLIMICAFLAQYLTDSETLDEYAKNNPETAYGTQTAAEEDALSKAETDTADSDNAASPADKKNPSDGTTDKPFAYTEPEDADTNVAPMEEMEKENPALNENPDRTTYQEGFYYEPLNEEIKTRITGISYPVAESKSTETAVPAINLIADGVSPAVSYDDLCYLSILHYDFDGKVQTGELICNRKLAQDFVEIFYELYRNEYQIEKIRLVDEYDGDDTASMADNNTSCFNYRVVDGTSSLSKHALGCAIDVNPFYNPYVVFNKDGTGETYISPRGSEIYADRSQEFAYKIDENDLCYRLFTEHGFTWGGHWNSSKDYQHFQKVPE